MMFLVLPAANHGYDAIYLKARQHLLLTTVIEFVADSKPFKVPPQSYRLAIKIEKFSPLKDYYGHKSP